MMAEHRQTPPLPNELPVVPLRGTVVLPLTVAPLGVSRPLSVEAINRALAGDRMVLLLLQNERHRRARAATTCTGRHGRHHPPDGQGPGRHARARRGHRPGARRFLQTEKGYLTALIKPLPEPAERSLEIDAHVRRLQELVDRALSLATGLSPDIRALVTLARRSAAPRLPARQPARHEGRGQAEAARGEQHLDQADAVADGAVARDRRARAEGQDRVARGEGDDRRAAPVRAAPADEGDPDRARRRRRRGRRSCASGSPTPTCRSTSPPSPIARSIGSSG